MDLIAMKLKEILKIALKNFPTNTSLLKQTYLYYFLYSKKKILKRNNEHVVVKIIFR